jgi:hypothetical protein
LPRRLFHHHNDAPQKTSPNTNYTEEPDPSPSYRRSDKRRKRGANVLAGVDWMEDGATATPIARREEEMKRFILRLGARYLGPLNYAVFEY